MLGFLGSRLELARCRSGLLLVVALLCCAVPILSAQEKPAAKTPRPKAPAPPRTSLADLAAKGRAEQFRLPELDDAQIKAAGVRKISGQHLLLYTDIPATAEAAKAIDELPAVFDDAVTQWQAYFFPAGASEALAAELAEWKIVGCLITGKEQRLRFAGTGLVENSVPEFLNGFQSGSQIWWYEQPSDYYRRHLMLHEGTHAFMERFLGGAGPPWYMEGMAELLGTHRWQAEGKTSRLMLGVLPQTKEEVPYWGRIKIIRDEYAASRGMTLPEIMRYGTNAHMRNEPYGWCWGASWFFSQHPQTRAAFLELPLEAKDRSLDFSQKFQEKLKPVWPQVKEDWELFVAQCDYGYDVARAAAVRGPTAPLPVSGKKVTLQANRGWQTSGIQVEEGKTYRLTASGRFLLRPAKDDQKTWPCEGGGITLHYHHGQPLGKLLAAVTDLDEPGRSSPLLDPLPIGLAGTLTPVASGTLYLSINEAASGLADNSGQLMVEVSEAKPVK